MSDQIYIFLDVDGVLNHHVWSLAKHDDASDPWTKARHWDRQLDPACIERVNRLVEALGAEVVLSSTWRKMDTAMVALNRNGIDWVDTTDCDGPRRGHEIARWMKANGVWQHQIVILDDDSDMEHLMPRLVKTSHQVGLTDTDCERVLRLFEKR